MFPRGFLHHDSGKSRKNRGGKDIGKRRKANRPLHIEALESRSLLSISASAFSAVASPYQLIGPVAAAASHLTSAPLAASAATHFVVTTSPGATSGNSVTVNVLAEDANNHLALGYSGTADVTSSDASATLPAPVVFKNGRASFQATFVTLGPQSVTVTDETTSTITGSANTNVVAPAVATHFNISLPSGATTGKAVTVQAFAVDAENHFVAGYSGTSTITSSDSSAILPAAVTFQNGHATFQVTFNATGLQSVVATDNANSSITGTASSNVIAPIVATHFVVALPPGAAAGSPVSIQLLAEDAQNHVVSGYNGTANITSSDGGASLPAPVTFQNGHASVQVTFATTGPQTVTATDTTDSTITGVGNTNVAIAHYVLHLPTGVTAGTAVTVQLVATDDQNHVLTNYSGTANLSTTDGAATLPATVTFQNGHASFQVTFLTPGQQTLSAIDSTSPTPVGAATTNVAVQAVATHYVVFLPHGATAGLPVYGFVVAEDAQNHIVPSYTGTANLTTVDGAATLPASVTFNHGYATFKVTFGTPGTESVTATDSSNGSLTGTATVNVAAAPVATHFVILMKPGATIGSPTIAVVVAEDAENHLVPNYTGPVTVTSSDAGATLPSAVTFDHGYATFKVTFANAGPQTVTVTDNSNSSLTGTATTNVVDKSSGGWQADFAGLGGLISRFVR